MIHILWYMTSIEALSGLLILSHLHIRVGSCFLYQIPIFATSILSLSLCFTLLTFSNLVLISAYSRDDKVMVEGRF